MRHGITSIRWWPWPQRPSISTVAVFVAGLLLGAMLWWLSPWFTGKVEPWDSSSHYYTAGLFGCGFVAACVSPRRFWAAPPGIYLGQFLYALATIPMGPFAPIGLMAGAVYCVLALAGAFVCFVIDWLLVRKRL